MPSPSTASTTTTRTASTPRISTTVSPSRVSVAPSTSFSSHFVISVTSIGSIIPPSSAEAVETPSGPGAPSISAVVALAVVFSLLGTVLLLALFLFAHRRRREVKKEAKAAQKVMFRYNSETVIHPPESPRTRYDRSAGLQGWTNARVDESGNGSSTLASPTASEATESAGYSPRSPFGPKMHRKPLPPIAMEQAHSSQWHETASQAIPIPNQRHPVVTHINSELEGIRGSPYHERTSSELFYAVPIGIQGPIESSPTPSSVCIHGSGHSHGEPPGFKVGNVSTNLPFVYFPQDHEGHISARASIHSGNTHAHNVQGGQRTRTRSLPMAQSHLRKARSVENIGTPKKPIRRPSRKEVPKYVLDESGLPGKCSFSLGAAH